MSRPSTIQTHRHRAEIEQALRHGVPVRSIESRYAVSRNALSRHRQKMVKDGILRQSTALPVLPSTPVIEGEIVAPVLTVDPDPIKHLRDLQELAARELNEALSRGEKAAALHWMKMLESLAETGAKLRSMVPVESPGSAEHRRRLEQQTKKIRLFAELADRVREKWIDRADDAASATPSLLA